MVVLTNGINTHYTHGRCAELSKMHYSILVTFLIILISGCNPKENGTYSILDKRLNGRVRNEFTRLENKVLETGLTHLGTNYLRFSKSLLSKYDQLFNSFEESKFDETIIMVQDFNKFIIESYPLDSLDNSSLEESLASSSKDNIGELKLAISLFTSELLTNLKRDYDKGFICYDFIDPLLVKQSSAMIGLPYKAELCLEAKRRAVKSKIEIDFINDTSGYYNLNVRNDGRAEINITKLTEAHRNVKFKITQWQDGEQKVIEKEMDLLK